jgi:hypothetical protein
MLPPVRRYERFNELQLEEKVLAITEFTKIAQQLLDIFEIFLINDINIHLEKLAAVEEYSRLLGF